MADPAGSSSSRVRETPRPSARTRARKAALDILFESELRGLDTGATLRDRQSAAAGQPGEPAVRPYTVELVDGVRDQRERIDELLTTYTQGWPLDRMAAVDRNILRLAVWELLGADVPVGVAISEAVGLAAQLSTDSSAAFVNGVLARIRDAVPRRTPNDPAEPVAAVTDESGGHPSTQETLDTP